MKNLVTDWDIGLLPLWDWPIVPWYSRSYCDHQCCEFHDFTWLFFYITVVLDKRPVPKEKT